MSQSYHLFKKRNLFQKILNYKSIAKSVREDVLHEMKNINRKIALREMPFKKFISKISLHNF